MTPENCTDLLNPATYGYSAQDGTSIFAADMDLESTWHLGKLSCLKSGYFLHVIFCYVVFFTGLGAMVSRVYQPLKWTHVWWGRAYIIAMLWTTATSMIIHNTGLPLNTLYLFFYIKIALAAGWVVVNFHQKMMQTAAVEGVQAQLAGKPINGNLNDLIAAQKGKIANSKTFKERLFSKKAAHGILMVTSWCCIAGRIFASNQSGDFTCHTQPVYKPLKANRYHTAGMDLLDKPLQLVPLVDPLYSRLPWAAFGEGNWTIMLLCFFTMASVGVGAAFSWYGAKNAAINANRDENDNYELAKPAAVVTQDDKLDTGLTASPIQKKQKDTGCITN